MIPDGTYTAVVDRIEDDLATLELTDDDGCGRDELVVAVEELPPAGRHADAVLRVRIVGDELAEVTYEPPETTNRQREAQERFDRLSERPPREDEER